MWALSPPWARNGHENQLQPRVRWELSAEEPPGKEVLGPWKETGRELVPAPLLLDPATSAYAVMSSSWKSSCVAEGGCLRAMQTDVF